MDADRALAYCPPRMRLSRSVITWGSALILMIALVRHYAWLGGPYFAFPETVQDHVWPDRFASRDMVVLARHAAKILPRDVTVTAIQPSLAPNYDITHFLTAAGLLPHQMHIPPAKFTAGELPRYVLAVRDELAHPSYRLHTAWPEGRLYEVVR